MKDKLINLLKILGPGIIFASICIGETHLALIPYAGALYGFALLWMIVFVHLVYYPIFEYGSRYAVATGEAEVAEVQRVLEVAGTVLGRHVAIEPEQAQVEND